MHPSTLVTIVLTIILVVSCGSLDEAIRDAKGDGSGSSKVEDKFKDAHGEDKGIDGNPPRDPKVQSDPLKLTAGLTTFNTCQALETYVEDEMIKMMLRQIDQQIKWVNSPNRDVIMAESAPNTANSGTADDSAQGKSAPDDFTTTNNQVEGVEESDFLKNTGTHIYHLAAGKLNVIKSWPPEAMSQIASVEIKGQPRQMLLSDTQLTVISQPAMEEIDPKYLPQGQSNGVDSAIGIYRSAHYGFLKVQTFDITDPASPRLKDTYILKGTFLNARRIDSSVRIVLNDYRGLPPEIKTYAEDYAVFAKLSQGEKVARLEELKEKNIAIIRAQTLQELLGSGDTVKVVGEQRITIADPEQCTKTYAPTVSTRFGLTRIATLNLADDSFEESRLLSYVRTLYSSETGMYLATPYYWWDQDAKNMDFTYLHKFDVSQPGKSLYLGSGGVPGQLLNQFSMDEYQDNLRIATTITMRSPVDSQTEIITWGGFETVNQISVLTLKENQLQVIGKTEELAKGERIFSARFKAERGFVVTFRQVDPLFTIDLKDPTNPQVVGELKVPGFSSYIHMIDDNHLLTIGRDATPEGRAQGLKLSIFDVSDMANPKESTTHLLGGRFWSQAQWDHKAFTYFPARKLLAIPATGYSYAEPQTGKWWKRYRSQLLVFDIDPAAIAQRGSVDMTDIYIDQVRPYSWWNTAARVSRSIFADDYVYAISNLGVRAVHTGDLTTPLSTTRYECTTDCFNNWWWY